jgi:hypothetical protein
MNESSHNVDPWQIRAEGVLPCAFCGGPPHFMPANGVYEDDFVTCSNPECFVRETSALPHRWNARPPRTPSTDEAITALNKFLLTVDRETATRYDFFMAGWNAALEAFVDDEAEQLAEHCRVNNIKGHSINADGSCNMGCC